eukprot:m.143765 g.143765  ORF g.143765 m.143765 type:complete len:609 (+) comp9667_c0_seq13:608-2434(+)
MSSCLAPRSPARPARRRRRGAASSACCSSRWAPGASSPASARSARISCRPATRASSGCVPDTSTVSLDRVKTVIFFNSLLPLTYFALFYFMINAGSLSMIITPKLRADVACFGQNECYPLAFGLPAVLMTVALLVFVAGRARYLIRIPSRNVIVETIRAIYDACALRFRRWRNGEHPEGDWLDAVADKYGHEFVADIKALKSVVVVFLPTPLFWTLYDQQGSRWTLQAEKMKMFGMGAIGDFQPDMMQAANTVLVLMMIPFFQRVVYPAVAACGINFTPLRRMTVGMVLCGVAFVVSGFVQLMIDDGVHMPGAAPGLSQIRFANTLTVPVNVTSSMIGALTVPQGISSYTTVSSGLINCTFTFGGAPVSLSQTAASTALYTVYLAQVAGVLQAVWSPDVFSSFAEPSNKGRLQFFNSLNETVALTSSPGDLSLTAGALSVTSFSDGEILSGDYTFRASSGAAIDMHVVGGALYTLALDENNRIQVAQDVAGNQVVPSCPGPPHHVPWCLALMAGVCALAVAAVCDRLRGRDSLLYHRSRIFVQRGAREHEGRDAGGVADDDGIWKCNCYPGCRVDRVLVAGDGVLRVCGHARRRHFSLRAVGPPLCLF